jgi:hypothetical protein
VVREVEFFSRLVAEDSWYFDLIRRYMFPLVAKSPIQKRIKRTVTGLDHDLPTGLAAPASCCGKSRSPVLDDEAILCASH